MSQYHVTPDFRCECGCAPWMQRLQCGLPVVLYTISCVAKECRKYGRVTIFRPQALGSPIEGEVVAEFEATAVVKYGFTGFKVSAGAEGGYTKYTMEEGKSEQKG